jgi:hypothetical protein
LFLGLLWPNQIPLPHLAFCLPLFMHALSVYTVISLHRGVGPCGLWRLVTWSVLLVGSVNILKHSARLSLQVMAGLKVTTPLFCLAVWFLSFPDHVNDRPSSIPCWVGLYFGGIRFRHIKASVVQLWGCSHPLVLSFEQPWQTHSWFCWWLGCWGGWRILVEVLIRSAT